MIKKWAPPSAQLQRAVSVAIYSAITATLRNKRKISSTATIHIDNLKREWSDMSRLCVPLGPASASAQWDRGGANSLALLSARLEEAQARRSAMTEAVEEEEEELELEEERVERLRSSRAAGGRAPSHTEQRSRLPHCRDQDQLSLPLLPDDCFVQTAQQLPGEEQLSQALGVLEELRVSGVSRDLPVFLHLANAVGDLLST
uniref:Uncharacterized protein LOC116938430 n=1 Tax=Petromyzon marinus TaxID=7757 RepID=A0AAJ7SL39_PETMA|nr:uncharacterized protein LOC116938430 [Petromyzon marinus]